MQGEWLVCFLSPLSLNIHTPELLLLGGHQVSLEARPLLEHLVVVLVYISFTLHHSLSCGPQVTDKTLPSFLVVAIGSPAPVTVSSPTAQHFQPRLVCLPGNFTSHHKLLFNFKTHAELACDPTLLPATSILELALLQPC